MWNIHDITAEILEQLLHEVQKQKNLSPSTTISVTVTDFLRYHLHISARNTQKLLRSKGVYLNKRSAHSKQQLKTNDVIKVKSLEEKRTLSLDNTPIEVLYEDTYTLVVNKPPYLVVHPTERTKTGTLSNRIAAYYVKTNQFHQVRPLHRLDRDTSGCILFAKTREAQQYYSEALNTNNITRTYHALIENIIISESEQNCINAPIGKDLRQPNRRCITEKGKAAQTYWHPLKTFESPVPMTLIEATIPTGRTHQIRVHFAHIGHPIIGDTMYGHKSEVYKRQCLHAYSLTFVPYKQNEKIRIIAPYNNFQ